MSSGSCFETRTRPTAASLGEEAPTAWARWYEEQRGESKRLPGPIPTALLLVPLLLLSLGLRSSVSLSQEDPAAEARILLEVLVTERGYRLRVTDVSREGWPSPLAGGDRAPLLPSRQSYVYRTGPLAEADGLLSAAQDLLGGDVRPTVWLRGEDAIPWQQMLHAAEALEPLTPPDARGRRPLAHVALDVRP